MSAAGVLCLWTPAAGALALMVPLPLEGSWRMLAKNFQTSLFSRSPEGEAP